MSEVVDFNESREGKHARAANSPLTRVTQIDLRNSASTASNNKGLHEVQQDTLYLGRSVARPLSLDFALGQSAVDARSSSRCTPSALKRSSHVKRKVFAVRAHRRQ